MFTVELQNGQTVQVPLEELETFLEQNRDQIKIQKTKMGKRRKSKEVTSSKL
ncbi:hypothetical protein [Aphanothece sacrum]|uniref:Uncharacterized protein n=1 Tax=Aphanothece sacrum FPU1 TaxID=1920663 RepID=A0A401IIU5_APHSA|nr:hypothetical protein [Aphanothece sacrum]GBF81232.1 hypothetical protein AsFPU1_2644 [Aphanothece sacrum FPU1]GBF83418.1 hypothetical protein AsFPU3_0460 [Aphanothece sacrum FPU3]